MKTIRSSTLDLLKEFAAAGGKIILAGDAPAYVDVLPSPAGKQIETISTVVPFEEDKIAAAVRKNTFIPVEAIDPETGQRIENIYCQVKQEGDITVLVTMNVSRDHTYPNVKLKVAAGGAVSEWDCESGEILQVQANPSGDWLEIQASFAEAEEHVYTISPSPVPGARKMETSPRLAEIPLSGPFAYSLDEPNICVLDMGYVEIEEQRKSDLMEILKIDEHIRDYYKLPYRAGNMVQPWFKTKFHEAPAALGKVRLHFPFYVEEVPGAGLAICMETPHEFKVLLNGQEIPLEDQGWWVDKAIRKFSLPAGLVKKGENLLVQEFDFRDDLDLEALYLMGGFSVRLEGNKKILGELPAKISIGDLAAQGFPFYTGGVVYKIPLLEDYSAHQKVMLEIPDFQAALVKVDPGQPDQKVIAWQPNRVEVTDNLQGAEALELELVLTRRNAFGPLHHTPFTYTTGPRHFLSMGENFTLNYMLYPSGILETPKLLIY
jgi:hypothetical protein